MINPLKIYESLQHLINRQAVELYPHVIRVEVLSNGSHLIVLPNGERAVLPAGTIFEYIV